MNNDDFGSAIMRIWLTRMLEGESQIREEVKWNRETKAQVPLAQAATVAVGVLAGIAGLSLLGWGVSDLVGLDIRLGDALLAGVGIVLLFMVSAVVARWVLAWQPTVVVGAFSVLLVLVLLAAIVLALAGERDLDLGHGVALVVSPAFMVSGAALTYRQLVDLLDPFGKTSPVERMMRPYLPQLFGSAQQTKKLAVPYRINGEMREPAALDMPLGASAVDIHPDDANLLDFVHEAARRGLSRRKWLVKGRPNYILPLTGTEVGRDTYDALIQRAVEWGFVVGGGDGHRAHWLMAPDGAIATLENEIAAQLTPPGAT